MSVGSQQTRLPGRRKLRHPELIPPAGAKAVGVDDSTQKIIYEMNVLDVQAMMAGKTQKLDYEGRPVFRKHPTTGEPMNAILVLPSEPIMRKKRFILNSTDSLKVKMIEGWEDTPAEVADRDRRAQEAAFSSDLSAEAVRRGFTTASEMMAALFGDAEQPKEIKAVIAEADAIEGMPITRPDNEDEVAVAPKTRAKRTRATR